MTAINAFLRRDRGFLMTDGAFYNELAEPLGFGSKAIAIPNLNAVIAARGYSGIGPTLAPRMSLGYRNFDDMIDRIEPDLVLFAEEHAQHLMAIGFPTFDLHILGWSEKDQKPKHFSFTNREGDAADYFKLDETVGYCLAPGLSEEEEFKKLPKVGVFTAKPGFALEFNPVLHGVQIMKAQRRQLDRLADFDDAGDICSVGGHIAVAEVSKDGITQRILHRWADEVGNPMKVDDLSGTDVAAAIHQHRAARAASGPPSNLNRQQRRAWEKKRGGVSA